jgi:hypothetical protein
MLYCKRYMDGLILENENYRCEILAF